MTDVRTEGAAPGRVEDRRTASDLLRRLSELRPQQFMRVDYPDGGTISLTAYHPGTGLVRYVDATGVGVVSIRYITERMGL